MPNPFFMSGVQFVDNLWIKDRTHFSDLKLNNENAQLSMMLSGLHNFTFNSFNTMPQMDMGMLLGTFWNNAFNQANAELSMMFANFPQMGNFQMPAFTPQAGVSTGSSASADLDPDLTDDEKKDAKNLQKKFNNQVDKYKDISAEAKKALGLDKIIADAKTALSEATTPEEIQKCIDDLDNAIADIPAKKLNTALELYKVAPDSQLDGNVKVLYDANSTKENILNHVNGYDGNTAVINAQSVIAEMDNRLLKEADDYALKALLSRDDSKEDEIKEAVKTIVNSMLSRADFDKCKDDTKVTEAREVLVEARNNYEAAHTNADNKKALKTAYENLYYAIKLAEAKFNDNKMVEDFVSTLPETLQVKYLDENGELKADYQIHKIKAEKEIERAKACKKDADMTMEEIAAKRNFVATANEKIYLDKDGKYQVWNGSKFVVQTNISSVSEDGTPVGEDGKSVELKKESSWFNWDKMFKVADDADILYF